VYVFTPSNDTAVKASQHDNRSWLAALVCALHASALALTVAEGADGQQARLTFAMARHALVDLALVLRRRPLPPPERLPADRLAALCEALRGAGVAARPAAAASLAELRGLYEPFAAGLREHFLLTLPGVYPPEERPDNWQTSAWMPRADPLLSLGAGPPDRHFD
jgi:hypothetical protein